VDEFVGRVHLLFDLPESEVGFA